MAVTVSMYGLFLKSVAQGKMDFENDVFKAMLVSAAYTFNQNAHQFKSAVNGEITGSGYTPGGQIIAGIGLTYSAKILTISASNLAWPVVTFTGARKLVVYNDSYDTEGSKPLVCCIDFGGAQSPVSQSFYYNWPSGVMLKLAIP